MSPPQAGPAVARARATMTPELVLVDVRLAEEARAVLPSPDDTLARIEMLVRANRIVLSRRAASPSQVPRRPLPGLDTEPSPPLDIEPSPSPSMHLLPAHEA